MFEKDVEFLEQYTDVVVLSASDKKARIAVSPALQGRVLTSTATGEHSFGWINREFIMSGDNNPHLNAYGGEDRIWLGPEGGQFSLYFAKGKPFELEHWFTPAAFNEEAFDVVRRDNNRILFTKKMQLVNYSDFVFDLRVDREVKILSESDIDKLLGGPVSVDKVAYESVNTITNTGDQAWKKETGLLSIWILGMFNPSPATTIVIPFRDGPESELGPLVNDRYFGKVPDDRLVAKDGNLYFSGDGKYRSKIGLSPQRCTPFAGSYDEKNKVLTLVNYSFSPDAVDYVNSMWEIQQEPYRGDVVNSYNDGPPEPGAKPLGPFYELESSSPAAALKPGERLEHIHRTVHLCGDEEALDVISQRVLKTSLAEIKNVFN
ncbi:hypothetical protein JW935_20935 [candidate division KSB1 bacterium]|nr:hypothetical protein [candidate division KSB1 bacterium]